MIDFWNRRLVKEQKQKIEGLEKTISELNREIIKAQKIIRGERIRTGYCAQCIHGVKPVPQADPFLNIFGEPYICGLECKCKDYERKQETMKEEANNG